MTPKFRDPIAWEATLPIRPSASSWSALLRGYYGTELTPVELELWRELTGLEAPQSGGYVELLVVAGRRGGKSETIARLAVFEAIHGGHGDVLAPGQVGLIVIISPLREQSREIIGYVKGLAALPQVKRAVVGDTADSVTFKTGIRVQVMTADAVNVSGPTIVMAIREEWAKHPGAESLMPDTEIENSLRPALAPVAGAPRRRLIGITSAYVKEGLAYQTDVDNFGKADAPVLVARGSTEQFNPNIDKAWLARERIRVGEVVYAREYLAQWVDAITDSWFGSKVVDQCIDRGRTNDDASPVKGVNYIAAIDAAFRGDKFALAIASREQQDAGKPPITVLEGVWSWHAPRGEVLSVEDTVTECANIIKEFNNAETYADQFGIDPLTELFLRHGVFLIEEPWTSVSKPSRFQMVRNAMSSDLVSLVDDPDLIHEFHGIRGKLLQSGGERIEGRSYDDCVHAAVLALSMAMNRNPDRRIPHDEQVGGVSANLTWGRPRAL